MEIGYRNIRTARFNPIVEVTSLEGLSGLSLLTELNLGLQYSHNHIRHNQLIDVSALNVILGLTSLKRLQVNLLYNPHLCK
jgi:hypothetical protein